MNNFPFSNRNPFPFKPKETKIREDKFYEMYEREESSSIIVALERLFNVKFNMNAQTWLLNHYWMFLLECCFSSQGGPLSKRLCRPYAYDYWVYTLPQMDNIFPAAFWILFLLTCEINIVGSVCPCSCLSFYKTLF